MTTLFRSVVLVLVLLGVALLAAARPASPQTPLPPEVHRPGQQAPAESPAIADMERRRAQAANKERHVELKRDTDRLLQLATELKLYVDKSNENMLSLNVVRKAEEIEKLAKSVKDKMKGQ